MRIYTRKGKGKLDVGGTKSYIFRMENHLIDEIIKFWLGDGTTGRQAWFVRNEAFDVEIREAYADHVRKAADGAYDAWRESARGCLALVILLDQFTRNIYRDQAQAFATDEKARTITRHALANGFDKSLSKYGRLFLYMPLEHSESLIDQDLSVQLIGSLDDEELTRHAVEHRDIICRFGRFPGRNAARGLTNTTEEAAYLAALDT